MNVTRHCTPNRLLRKTSNLVPSSPASSSNAMPATPWTTAASDDGSNSKQSPEFISNVCRWVISGVWMWKVAVRPRLNKTTQLPSLQWSTWGGKQLPIHGWLPLAQYRMAATVIDLIAFGHCNIPTALVTISTIAVLSLGL